MSMDDFLEYVMAFALCVLMACLIVGSILFFTGRARAHDAKSGWSYPIECCSGYDCYEIDESALQPVDGGWKVKATGEFFSAEKTKVAPDGRFHRCSVARAIDGRTLCLFAPPMGF